MKYLFPLFIIAFFSCNAFSQNPVNWTSDELMQPAQLAKHLSGNSADLPVIYCVGPGAEIPHSIDIGMTKDEANLNKLKTALSKLDKSKPVVIYCGCCPFEHCPNVRPAVALLKEMKFTNFHLLNLEHNIKQDWIDKGYPVAKS